MALPNYLYRDPCDVLEQKQERELRMSCSGCVNSFKMEVAGSIEQGCSKGNKFGRRCNLYQSGGNMFRDVEHALNWSALVKCSLIIDKPSINGMRGINASAINELLIGLSPQQRQMQANSIYKYACELSGSAESQYIKAKYFYENDIDNLMHMVFSAMPSPGGVYRRGIQSIVMDYMGRQTTSHRNLRDQLHCGNDRVHLYKDQVHAVLNKVHARALNELDARMTDIGLVQKAS